jgi:serine protease Do
MAATSFAEAVATARRSTVRVLAAGKAVALGTVVGASGLVVTKSSEVADSLECELGDGTRVAAAVVARDEDADLALLRVEADGLVPVTWAEDATPLPGAWVASAGPGRQPVAIGTVSVAARRPSARAVRRNTLRVELASDRERARVRAVPHGSSAARAGLLPGDVIVRVADWPVHSARSLGRALARKSKGERVAVAVQRGDEELVLEAEVEETVDRSPRNAQERLWGPLSTVRAGFAEVLQHDTVLAPHQCGGPLVDVEGRVVGVNIARSGRVESLALPARHARALVAALLASAR